MTFLTLRVRTFLFMVLIILVAFVLTGVFSLYHFKRENEEYHYDRLERKEQAIISHLDYLTKDLQGKHLSASQWRVELSGKIAEISAVHHLDLGVYHPDGRLIAGSLIYSKESSVLPQAIEPRINANASGAMGPRVEEKNGFLIGTNEIYGPDNEVELIVRVPYELGAGDIPDKDYEFLRQLGLIYILMFLVGIILAIILSNYISKNMTVITEKLRQVRLNQRNEKLEWRFNDEIGELIHEYNTMVEKLESTAVDLARSERESAWKEMAQQVAHEIKNPLTPMKLTLQMMQREKDVEELHEMVSHLLEEVESLTHIAEAFSRFAQMPGLVLEAQDISYLTSRALSLYLDHDVQFLSPGPLHAKVDKEQWTRIVHNLVKNALQSIPEDRTAEILVEMTKGSSHLRMRVKDNGSGIPESARHKVFEPSFTTKSSGMGLGLAMVKNLVESFGGTIWFETSRNGTEFIIELPLTAAKSN